MCTEWLWSWSQRLVFGGICADFHAETDGDGLRTRNITDWGRNWDSFFTNCCSICVLSLCIAPITERALCERVARLKPKPIRARRSPELSPAHVGLPGERHLGRYGCKI